MRSSSRLLDKVALDFISKRLFWHGRITRQEVMHALNVGSAKATRLLSSFREQYADQLLEEGKGYVPTSDFHPPGISGDRYLDDLLSAVQQGIDASKVAGENSPISVLPVFRKHVKTEVLRELLGAIRRCEAVTISYVGMAVGADAKTRTVEPVEFVYVNDRWHLRAFCYQVADWRDFVLSRITAVLGTKPAKFRWLKTGYPSQKKEEKATFVPHPNLTEDQKAVVAFEYGMENGMLEIELSKSDLFYFMERHVARSGEEPPQKLLIKK